MLSSSRSVICRALTRPLASQQRFFATDVKKPGLMKSLSAAQAKKESDDQAETFEKLSEILNKMVAKKGQPPSGSKFGARGAGGFGRRGQDQNFRGARRPRFGQRRPPPKPANWVTVPMDKSDYNHPVDDENLEHEKYWHPNKPDPIKEMRQRLTPVDHSAPSTNFSKRVRAEQLLESENLSHARAEKRDAFRQLVTEKDLAKPIAWNVERYGLGQPLLPAELQTYSEDDAWRSFQDMKPTSKHEELRLGSVKAHFAEILKCLRRNGRFRDAEKIRLINQIAHDFGGRGARLDKMRQFLHPEPVKQRDFSETDKGKDFPREGITNWPPRAQQQHQSTE